jgi:hypothetical protein
LCRREREKKGERKEGERENTRPSSCVEERERKRGEKGRKMAVV